MGTDFTSSLAYGVQINASVEDLDLNESDELRVVYSGNAYAEEMDRFVCIKESYHVSRDGEGKFISADKLAVPKNWDRILTKWCKGKGIKDPKIGWWLCSSLS